MLLRDHPLMCYKGVPNWPPTWTWMEGPEDKHPTGEIRILRTVLLPKLQRANKCFLLIFYEQSLYGGCLLFDDYPFCKQVTQLLQSCRNRSITDISGLDLSHTL